MTLPNGNGQDAVLARAESLQQSMDNLREEFVVVQKQEEKNRAFLWVLGTVTLISIVAIVIAIVVSVQASHASNNAKDAASQSNINRRAQAATCAASNDTRKVALQLWDFLLTASLHGNPPPTGKVKQQLDQFQRMVNAAYQPRNCSSSALAASAPPATPTH